MRASQWTALRSLISLFFARPDEQEIDESKLQKQPLELLLTAFKQTCGRSPVSLPPPLEFTTSRFYSHHENATVEENATSKVQIKSAVRPRHSSFGSLSCTTRNAPLVSYRVESRTCVESKIHAATLFSGNFVSRLLRKRHHPLCFAKSIETFDHHRHVMLSTNTKLPSERTK